MKLQNKTIYILSYEEWGDMLMSKHHYAVELGKRGNRVFFVNHPDLRNRLKRGEIKIADTRFPNVKVVKSRLLHPYFLKFKWYGLYKIFTGWHVKRMISLIGKPDLIWSFETGNGIPLEIFPSDIPKIYMPVDGPFNHHFELKAGNAADLIVSVTQRILTRYDGLSVPKYQVNHGVADVFINENLSNATNNPVRIGYAGSLVRNDLDIATFKTLIQEHPDKVFEFWGENDPSKSSIHMEQDIHRATIDYLEFLRSRENVILHGAVRPDTLSEGLKRMDLLLIAYNIMNDQNHHKVLEYLGAGKAIISSYMSSYEHLPHLLYMTKTKENNIELPVLFNSVVSELNEHNALDKQFERVAHAKEYTYCTQVDRISKMLDAALKQ